MQLKLRPAALKRFSQKVVPSELLITQKDKEDVWNIFTPLANKHNAVNLGQGFPNFPAADFIKENIQESVFQDFNQYAPTRGHPSLLEPLSKYYSSKVNMDLKATENFIVTQGANQGILNVLQGFLNVGDEVLMIEPFFDIYKMQIDTCRAIGKSVPLRLKNLKISGNVLADDWELDYNAFEAAITSKTKIFLLNTPHNPSGKVFSRTELCKLGEICIRHNLLILSDEVYEELTFDGTEQCRICSLPGLWNRTLTVGSAGKMFGVTGWRIGWIYGPKELIDVCLKVQAMTVFSSPTPNQVAIGKSLQCSLTSKYFPETRALYLGMRNLVIDGLEKAGIRCAVPSGSYFLLADFGKYLDHALQKYSGLSENDDYKLCRWLTTEIGVTAIPPSAFYSPENKDAIQGWVRLCFAKDSATISEAMQRLQKLKSY